MMVLSSLPESLPVLFLIAAVGLGSTLFSFPGFLPDGSDAASQSTRRPFTLGAAMRFGLAAFLLAVPGFILLQGMVRLPGGRWIATLAGPVTLAGLFWLAGSAIRKWPILQAYADTVVPREGRLQLAAFSGVLALYPALDPVLAGGSMMRALVYFAGTGCGLLLAMGVVGAVIERTHREDLPSWARGIPALLVVSGLIAMAWMGLFRFFS